MLNKNESSVHFENDNSKQTLTNSSSSPRLGRRSQSYVDNSYILNDHSGARRNPIRKSYILPIMEAQTKSQKISKQKSPKKSIDFKEYTDLIGLSMARYQEATVLTDISEKEDLRLSYIEETNIRSLLRRKGDSSLFNQSDESMMKISISEKEYKNPFDSFRMLKKNKKIFEEVSQCFLQRQEAVYSNALEQLSKETMQYKVKMPQVKVTGMMAKINTDKNVKPIAEVEETETKSTQENERKKKGSRLSRVGIDKITDLPSLIEDLGSEKNPRLFAFYKYTTKNFPEGREQFALDYDLTKIILWGGITSNKSSDVWSMNPETFEWIKLETENNYPPITRFGHSGLLFERKLFVFGGKAKNNNYTYHPDLEYYSLDDKTWASPVLNTTSFLKLRKNHVADFIGRQMIIHGGHTENNEFLNDTVLLNMNPLKWIVCPTSEDHPAPTLSGHGSCLVLPSEIRYSNKFNIYKYPELGIGGRLNKAKIKEKGWYIFGGRSKEEGGICNDLWIVRLGKKPLEWFKPETIGNPPSPRYSHSQNFYEAGNFVIIHGGRNDLSSESFALNDTYVLELTKLEWTCVKLYSDCKDFSVYNRCGHSAVVHTNKLIVFGGMNNNNYLGSSMFVIHLDFHSKPVRISEDEKAIEMLQNNMHQLNIDGLKKLDRLKKKVMKRKLSIVEDLILPPIK